MKCLFTVLISLISTDGFSQYSLGAVCSPRGEILTENYYYFSENPTVYYGLGFDYNENKMNFSVDALHLFKRISNSERDVSWGPHGSYTNSVTTSGNADVYYLALKLGLSHISEGKHFAFLFGATLQSDFLYLNKEYDKISTHRWKNGDVYETYYTEAEDYRVAGEKNNVLTSLGLRTALRIHMKERAFAELGINFGIQSASRFITDNRSSASYLGLDLKFSFRNK